MCGNTLAHDHARLVCAGIPLRMIVLGWCVGIPLRANCSQGWQNDADENLTASEILAILHAIKF